MRLPVFVALAALGFAGVSHAASFDCAKARRADEKAICAGRKASLEGRTD